MEWKIKVFIVVITLYVLNSASVAFRSFMANKLDEIGFKSRPADTNVWYRPEIKPDSEEYYEYELMYVDDILEISIDLTKILKSMEDKKVKYKKGKIAPLEMYLGERVKIKMINGSMCWTITSYDYVIASVKTIKDAIARNSWKIPKTAYTPMTKSFVPELWVTEELGPDGIQ